ncbi:helix-turn-helix domain-containing protein [Brevundimonas sp.]|uniref:helix-turn-helix domain-containing protein n=1 Tax=Brevundimonas sp. TaxID=1871086 RepID=UPI00289E7421|nr:helix-turn-helix domain-containing protein [Brevundimonas sp.]
MVDTTEHDRLARERAGAALKILRKRAGMTQEDAAGAAERISLPSWKNYERGLRFMDNPTLARALRAIGSTPDEHALEMQRLVGPVAFPDRPDSFRAGMEERGRVMALPVGGIAHGGALRPNIYDDGGEAEVIDFAQFFAPGTRVLRLGGMSMVPYAEPGGFVTYNPRQPARRGQGCVIEMKDGSYAVKRFERTDEETLYVTELYPEERELQFPLRDVHGVYAIGLRGD